jgi:HEAT repeat protein
MDRDMVVPVVSKMLGDPALGVRGAAAWLVGELGLEELCPSVQRALDSEKQEDVKKSLERAIVRLRKAGGKP